MKVSGLTEARSWQRCGRLNFKKRGIGVKSRESSGFWMGIGILTIFTWFVILEGSGFFWIIFSLMVICMRGLHRLGKGCLVSLRVILPLNFQIGHVWKV